MEYAPDIYLPVFSSALVLLQASDTETHSDEDVHGKALP